MKVQVLEKDRIPFENALRELLADGWTVAHYAVTTQWDTKQAPYNTTLKERVNTVTHCAILVRPE